jgi:hypothetical protein
MIVVSNSSPLISLGAIGRLELLLKLYGAISIPRAVHHEVTVTGSGRPGAVEVQSFAWITCCDVGNPTVVTALQGKLDRGEAEAIALALELPADPNERSFSAGSITTTRVPVSLPCCPAAITRGDPGIPRPATLSGSAAHLSGKKPHDDHKRFEPTD